MCAVCLCRDVCTLTTIHTLRRVQSIVVDSDTTSSPERNRERDMASSSSSPTSYRSTSHHSTTSTTNSAATITSFSTANGGSSTYVRCVETKDDYAVPARGCTLSPDGRLAIGEYVYTMCFNDNHASCACVCVCVCVCLCRDCRRRLLLKLPFCSVYYDLCQCVII